MTEERACATAPALPRRTLLTALPATGLALAAPGTADPEELDSTISRIFQEWRDHFEYEGRAAVELDDDAFRQVCDTRREIECRMFEQPSQSPLDVLRKLVAFTYNGEVFDDDGRIWSAVIMAEAKLMAARSAAPQNLERVNA